MLRQVIQEIQATGGAISLRELCRRLDVEESALEGMLDHLVRMGLLGMDGGDTAETCAGSHLACGAGFEGCLHCPFHVQQPKRYRLKKSVPDSRSRRRIVPDPQ